jgi:hypothetical protein
VLERSRQFRAIGSEDQLEQAAPKSGGSRAHRIREQELLDHVSNVIVVIGECGPPTRVEVKGKIDVDHGARPQMAVTRVCVARISSGVPVGVQIAWLSSSNSGWPFDVTRVADVMNWAVTHGPFAPGGGGSVQPATT